MIATERVLIPRAGEINCRTHIENTLSHFVDSNGRCKICGHDHSFKPDLRNISTSNDVISELLGNAKPKEILKQHA
jgi:hypothetical protein